MSDADFTHDVFLSHMLCMSAHAFGSDWAQLGSGTFRFRDPLNKEGRRKKLEL
jgi:hypothetical protein